MGNLERIVAIRHGEGEGDVRRAAHKKGNYALPTKPTILEELTPSGREQCRTTGLYVQENMLSARGLAAVRFDLFVVAPSPRTRQSADESGLPVEWQVDERLGERDRGLIKGWWAEKHKAAYPESYQQMITDPLRWVPPGGESILDMAYGRVAEVVEEWEQKGYKNVMVVGHRDWIQALLVHILGEPGAQFDTETIKPASIVEITRGDPGTDAAVNLVCPWDRVLADAA